jgi:hypothetical protein
LGEQFRTVEALDLVRVLLLCCNERPQWSRFPEIKELPSSPGFEPAGIPPMNPEVFRALLGQ